MVSAAVGIVFLIAVVILVIVAIDTLRLRISNYLPRLTEIRLAMTMPQLASASRAVRHRRAGQRHPWPTPTSTPRSRAHSQKGNWACVWVAGLVAAVAVVDGWWRLLVAFGFMLITPALEDQTERSDDYRSEWEIGNSSARPERATGH